MVRVLGGGTQASCLPSYVEAKQRQNVLDYDDLLLYWAQMVSDPTLADDIGGRFDHVLVDEYQDTNRLQASILLALKPTGRGLTVVGDDAQSIYSFRAATVRNILDFPGQFSPPAEIVTLDRNYRSTQPILAAANAVIDLASERFTKNLWTDRTGGERPRLVCVRDETDQAYYIVERVLENREGRLATETSGSPVSRLPPQWAARGGTHPPQHPLREVRGPQVPRCGTCQRHAGTAALCREPARRVAGFRVMLLVPGVGPTSAQRALDLMADAADPIEALIASAATPLAPAPMARLRRYHGRASIRQGGWPAELERARLWYEPHLERIHEDAVDPPCRPHPARADRERLSLPGAFPHRTHARSAGRYERPGGHAAPRRGLPDPFDDPFRQGPGMEVRVRAECRSTAAFRRISASDRRRDRGGAASALCRA